VEALHIHMEGFTAFFKIPWSITASQLTMSCPSYSNILGLLSACTNKIVTKDDTRIGFEFNHISEGEELERTERFELSGKYLKPHHKGHGILYRQIHFRPTLDLYLTNVDFKDSFDNPAAPLTLGRSQDLCWITKVEEVELTRVKSGNIGSTMISGKFLNKYISPELVRCAEWFDNNVVGITRRVGGMGFFQVIPPSNIRMNIAMNSLYHPSNLNENDVIYLHEWSKPLVRLPPKKKRTK